MLSQIIGPMTPGLPILNGRNSPGLPSDTTPSFPGPAAWQWKCQGLEGRPLACRAGIQPLPPWGWLKEICLHISREDETSAIGQGAGMCPRSESTKTGWEGAKERRALEESKETAG